MEPSILNNYRCSCGKLLFKGLLLSCKLEIKCKRCGQTRTFKNDTRGIRSFMLVVNGTGKVVDACGGVAALGCSRENVIGKPLFDILPIVRDASYQEIIPAILKPRQGRTNSLEPYQIKNNTLILRDRKAPLESHVVQDSNNESLFRVFNVIKEV